MNTRTFLVWGFAALAVIVFFTPFFLNDWQPVFPLVEFYRSFDVFTKMMETALPTSWFLLVLSGAAYTWMED